MLDKALEAELAAKPLMVILPMSRAGHILLEPFHYIWVEIPIDKFVNEFSPVFWARVNRALPIGQSSKLNPKFVWECFFPGPHALF
jgi:hypothetical protein